MMSYYLYFARKTFDYSWNKFLGLIYDRGDLARIFLFKKAGFHSFYSRARDSISHFVRLSVAVSSEHATYGDRPCSLSCLTISSFLRLHGIYRAYLHFYKTSKGSFCSWKKIVKV